MSTGFSRFDFVAAVASEPSDWTVTPVATGGIDVRSRPLAETLGTCKEALSFVQEAWAGGHSGCKKTDAICSYAAWEAACDAWQGYLIAKCHDWQRSVYAEHIDGAKFDTVIEPGGPGIHTSLVHGFKDRLQLYGAVYGGHLPTRWVWNMGAAMRPLPYELFRRPPRLGIGWRPLDWNATEAYMREANTADGSGHDFPSCSKLRRHRHKALPCPLARRAAYTCTH